MVDSHFELKLVNGDIVSIPAQNVTPETRQEAIALMIMTLAETPAIHGKHGAIICDKVLSVDLKFDGPKKLEDEILAKVIPINSKQMLLDFEPEPQQILPI